MLVHRRVTPSIKFASTHLYTWVERGTVRVKCLAQEHNTMSPSWGQTGIQLFFKPWSNVKLLCPTFCCTHTSFLIFCNSSCVLHPPCLTSFKGVGYPKIWQCSWKIQFLGNTRLKTLDDLSKKLWNDLAEFPSRWVWNLRKVHSGISFFT